MVDGGYLEAEDDYSQRGQARETMVLRVITG